MSEIVAVIPIKRHSERVASKNIRPFADTTLFELKLQQLKPVDGFVSKVVASEDDEILEIATSYGFEVLKRNPYYSTSHVPMSEVYSYIGSNVEGQFIAWINVTNPLAETEVYERALRKFDEVKDHDIDCFLSVWELKENIFFQGKPVNFQPYPWPRSQDLQDCYAMSFIINISSREDLIAWGSCVGEKPYFYILDSLTSTDIDFEEDFQLCEAVYKERKRNGLSREQQRG